MDALEFYGRTPLKTNLTRRIESIWHSLTENAKNKDASRPVQRSKENEFDPFISSLLGPTVVWKTFPTQSEALKYATAAGDDVHVFAYESPTLHAGGRRYLVTSYEHFWHVYSKTDKNYRFLYEVIKQNLPVKLYFDLEFNRELNADKKGDYLVDLLLTEIRRKLEELFGRSFETEPLIQLDASTPTKFSQHLIFPTVVFLNFEHAGNFVDLLCESILSKCTSTSSLQSMLVNTAQSPSGNVMNLFVDRGVYTKNRNFRIYMSSKLGKYHPLLLVPESPFQDQSQREIFFLSLICNVPMTDAKTALQFDGLNGRERLHKRKKKEDQNMTVSTGYQESPFPKIDAFINQVITANNCSGRIRQWQFFQESFRLIYAIAGGYKYCDRKKDHHKSNNILFVVDPEEGTYHQKCLDPECKLVNFRSIDYLLPFRMERCDPTQKVKTHGTNYNELDPNDDYLFWDSLRVPTSENLSTNSILNLDIEQTYFDPADDDIMRDIQI